VGTWDDGQRAALVALLRARPNGSDVQSAL